MKIKMDEIEEFRLNCNHLYNEILLLLREKGKNDMVTTAVLCYITRQIIKRQENPEEALEKAIITIKKFNEE